MRKSIIPNDSINRVQRLTTYLQRLSHQCEWHKNYTENTLSEFQELNKKYLFPLGTYIYDCMQEMLTGPNLLNQKEIYRFVFDVHKGILRRYDEDTDSEFYTLKVDIFLQNK